MSNRIDFYQADRTSLAVGAIRPVVFINGCLCDDIEVTEIVRGEMGEYGWAKLRLLGGGWGELYLDESTPMPRVGRSVDIVSVYPGDAEGQVCATGLFSGQIECIEGELGDTNVVEATARDISARLSRIRVGGRRVESSQGSVRVNALELVFGENASLGAVTRNGKTSRVFAAEDGLGKVWSCGEAVEYLLDEFVPFGMLEVGPVEHIDAIMSAAVCDGVDVEGLTLLDAMEKVCRAANVKFHFVSRCGMAGPVEGIVFYRPGAGRCVELDMQRTGEVLSSSWTQVAKFKLKGDTWPLTRRYTAMGESKQFEATFEMIGAWDDSFEGKTQTEYASEHAEFDSVRDVYRKWCLNEAGDYSGDMYDFSKMFGDGEYVCRRRCFLDCISVDIDGNSYGIHVEVSYDSGVTWQVFDGSFDNLSDQCGIWISDPDLGNDYYTAADSGQLCLRVTATVVGDERIACTVADGPVGSSAQVVDVLVKADGTYRYECVTGRSIFYCDGGGIDDSESLMDAVRHAANSDDKTVEEIEISTPILRIGYQPGDRVVSAVDGRDVFGGLRDGRSEFVIERIAMDFQMQQTRLKVARRRGFEC